MLYFGLIFDCKKPPHQKGFKIVNKVSLVVASYLVYHALLKQLRIRGITNKIALELDLITLFYIYWKAATILGKELPDSILIVLQRFNFADYFLDWVRMLNHMLLLIAFSRLKTLSRSYFVSWGNPLLLRVLLSLSQLVPLTLGEVWLERALKYILHRVLFKVSITNLRVIIWIYILKVTLFFLV